ncbi:hypothetical protein [Leptolyngbya ohadii]|uniref:hypothetical protein n=1 Tax=Leptolyngbya ohadii TaxID=1962290 RepID=UPI000B5A0227|nr:hypothetical protein [Leptolyngbya ohadii]
MKSKLFRLVTICLVAVLTLTLFVQSPAFAKEADEGRGSGFKSWVTKPTTRPGTGSPSLENVVDALQGDFTGLFESDRTGDGADIKPSKTDSERDRERRDTVKEVTGERHTPGGGPQDQ